MRPKHVAASLIDLDAAKTTAARILDLAK